MSGASFLICLFLAIFLLLVSFIELLSLIVKTRLPDRESFLKKWEARGVVSNTAIQPKKKEEKNQLHSKDVMMITVVGIGIFFVGMLFFQNEFFALLFSCLAFFFPRFQRGRYEQRRRSIFLNQFRDGMYSIANSLRAGSSLQTALKRCEEDLRKEHMTQKEKPMLEEIIRINQDIEFGMSIDQAMRSFKERMNLEDVDHFVDSILITRAKGGNLTKVIQNTSERIADKISIQQEIQVATAQKRSEAKVLTFFPVIIVFILMVVNPEYMRPMYENVFGNFMLFIAAIMLVVNYVIGKKITDINL